MLQQPFKQQPKVRSFGAHDFQNIHMESQNSLSCKVQRSITESNSDVNGPYKDWTHTLGVISTMLWLTEPISGEGANVCVLSSNTWMAVEPTMDCWYWHAIRNNKIWLERGGKRRALLSEKEPQYSTVQAQKWAAEVGMEYRVRLRPKSPKSSDPFPDGPERMDCTWLLM